MEDLTKGSLVRHLMKTTSFMLVTMVGDGRGASRPILVGTVSCGFSGVSSACGSVSLSRLVTRHGRVECARCRHGDVGLDPRSFPV